DAALSGERHDALADVLALVIDHMVGARPPRDLALGRRAHGGDDGGFAFLRELDGVMAHRARARGDEHGRALRDAPEQDRLIRGIGWNAEKGYEVLVAIRWSL